MRNDRFTYVGRILYMYYRMKLRTRLKKFCEIIPKENFITIARNSAKYADLYSAWSTSGYLLKYTPTVDRVDNSAGYVKENIQFLSYADNQSKGSVETNTGRSKLGKPVTLVNKMTGDSVSFINGTLARNFLGLPKTRFYTYLKNNKTYGDWKISYSEV